MSVGVPATPAAGPEPGHSIDSVVERVTGTVGRFQREGADVVQGADVTEIRQLVVEEWQRYDHARVRTFVPVLVHRAVVERLVQLPRPAQIVPLVAGT